MLILDEVRCPDCGRKLMELCGQARVKCPKCKAMVFADSNKRKESEVRHGNQTD